MQFLAEQVSYEVSLAVLTVELLVCLFKATYLMTTSALPQAQALDPNLKLELSSLCSQIDKLTERNCELSNWLSQIVSGTTSNLTPVQTAFATAQEHCFGELLDVVSGASIDSF